MEMTQQTSSVYPNTASILALAGGILMVLSGGLLLAVSVFILPNLDYTNLPPPANVSNMAGLVSGAVGMVGLFGLISGIIVIVSAAMLQADPNRRRTWGVLTLVFSVLSFLGLGGFIVGAILGIVGGAKALTWKSPTQ
jgi:hypothetical protein